MVDVGGTVNAVLAPETGCRQLIVPGDFALIL